MGFWRGLGCVLGYLQSTVINFFRFGDATKAEIHKVAENGVTTRMKKNPPLFVPPSASRKRRGVYTDANNTS